MDENKNLWNKKADELTVGDIVKVNVMVPIVMIGGMMAAGTIVATASKAADKFREIKVNRQNKKLEK